MSGSTGHRPVYSPYAEPDPVAVAEIYDDYGPHAALERWSSWSAKHIKQLASEGRKIRAEAEAAGHRLRRAS